MEVHISNSFLHGFVSKYSNENAAKVVKYLAVLGVYFLQTANKQNVTFSELQSLAKGIIETNKPKAGSSISQELLIIKDELAKLSQRVEGKLGSPTPPKKEETPLEKLKSSQKPIKEPKKVVVGKTQSTGKQGKFDPRALTHKPPSAWREGDKKTDDRKSSPLGNIEEINEPSPLEKNVSPANRSAELHHGSLGSSRGEKGITPKPNEVAFTGVDIRENKNKITRHHLDDTEAKKSMTEEGVIYFPEAERPRQNSVKRETPKTKHEIESPKTKHGVESPFFAVHQRPHQLADNCVAEWSEPTESIHTVITQALSPHFLHSKYGVLSDSLPVPKDKENIRSPNASSSIIPEGSLRAIPTTTTIIPEGKKSQPKMESSKSSQSNLKKIINEKTTNRILGHNRTNSRQSNSHSQPASTSSGYRHVESKIKDEINYHKELSKQYKKMKHSIENSEGFDDHMALESSTRLGPTRENTSMKWRAPEKDESYAPTSQNPLEESSRYKFNSLSGSRLMESTNSNAKSSLTMQQLSHQFNERNPYQSYQSVTNKNKRFDNSERYEGANSYKVPEEPRGGMLDIANSFLNSPLMQNISNIDIKHFDSSLKESMANPNKTRPKTPDTILFTSHTNFKEADQAGRSFVYDMDDDFRFQTSQGLQQSRNSKWGNAPNQMDRNTRVNASILKDSTNRRFGENITKELAGGYFSSKEEPNSLASSNFSNFLNDEMKGFYQKEGLDVNKPKLSKFASSGISSNMSFNANEIGVSKERKPYFGRNESDDIDNTKNGEGFSFDNANVFKNERMSVTQLLDN